MKSLVSIVNDAAEYLKKRGVQNPRRQAEEIISLSLDIPRLGLYVEYDRPVTENELTKLRQNLKRRGDGEPSGYIFETLPFLDCSLYLNKNVLIPRPETEILADRIAQEIAAKSHTNKNFLDLCCGSGCIGIAVKKRCPELNVILSDLSIEALEVAKNNAEINNVIISFLQGDLLSAIDDKFLDFLVCNPPYISEKDYENLDSGVKNYEPKTALLAGATGLEFYIRLSQELPRVLKDRAQVWFEIGYDQGESVKKIFNKESWKDVTISKDWSSHDRYFSCIFGSK